ncbi:MAG: (2Fe-2S)-binding protein, partial [Rhodospirillaceae bacterium]|nr:(2Fe-2S)-binding protein [Rhodospirillaceae bacterium]
MTAPRFRRLAAATGPELTIYFDGRAVSAQPGDNVAAALLAAGVLQFRTTPGGGARGPFCMIGNCFDCLVRIDGQGNVRSCQTAVR